MPSVLGARAHLSRRRHGRIELGYRIGQTHALAFLAEGAAGLWTSPTRCSRAQRIAWAGYGDVDLLVWEPHPDDRFAVLWESENSARALLGDAGARRRRRA